MVVMENILKYITKFTASSSGSGYGSERRDAASSITGTWSPKASSSAKSHSEEVIQIVICPSCKYQHTLPHGGVSSLPSNNIIQNRLRERSSERNTIQVLCDLCAYDVPVSFSKSNRLFVIRNF